MDEPTSIVRMGDERPNVAIFYRREGYDAGGTRLMGRQAAGEGFLRGWVQHADVASLACYCANEGDFSDFKQQATAFGSTVNAEWLPVGAGDGLTRIGALFLPGPSLAQHAWQRRVIAPRCEADYSIVGITHTTASGQAMDAIADLLTGPVKPWDALICTSSAVQTMARTLIDEQLAYLQERFGAGVTSAAHLLPQMPVIPLGIDTAAFQPQPGQREKWRDHLGIDSDDIAVLFVGRMSFHAKAHPMAMYRALEESVQSMPTGGKLHLIEVGWFANDAIRAAYDQVFREICPNVLRHVLNGTDPIVKSTIWSAADIFCSLSDNIQETFGLTPVEAMAAGLPCVITDWDGYKDTVRHGVDGYRIRTWAPSAGDGEDLAILHALGVRTYDQYCGDACQYVAVDHRQLVAALCSLLSEPGLRAKMSASARVRARSHFDWGRIILLYQELLSELTVRRAVEGTPITSQARRSWPSRADPFLLFGGYPTVAVNQSTLVKRISGRSLDELCSLYVNPMVRYAVSVLPPPDDVVRILGVLPSEGYVTIAKISDALPLLSGKMINRSLTWLAKYGYVEFESPKFSS